MSVFDQHLFDDILDFLNRRVLIGLKLCFQDFHYLIAQAFSNLFVPAPVRHRGAINRVGDPALRKWNRGAVSLDDIFDPGHIRLQGSG